MTSNHIKMPDIAPLVRYVADGVQTVFAFPFPIFASEDLIVLLGGAPQSAGFTITGAGVTQGGAATFDTAPSNNVVVTLQRVLPLERLTDFLEGGDFSAQAINTELDFIIAAIQQVENNQSSMLRYLPDEAPANFTLPTKSSRTNKVLGFDSAGAPIAVSAEGTMASPDFTASGAGAATRSSADKLSDMISVRDFGAIGDGITSDTLSIQQALAAHKNVFVPEGTYLITAPLTLSYGQSLFGAIGIFMSGGVNECVQNAVTDVNIIAPRTGLKLDSGNDSNKPLYWNNFSRVFIERPATHGVHMVRGGLSGDTPNANRFHSVRVFSKGAGTTGSGFYIQDGSFNNSFIDCEANVNGPTADSCFRIGAGSNKTLIVNLLCESNNLVPNLKLDAGSIETSIFNLSAESNGAAIYDFSGGNYDAFNAGSPAKNRLRRTTVTDLKATLMRFDTEFIDTAGNHNLDLSHSVHIVDATNGAMTITLPKAGDAAGVEMVIKKKDNSSNIVTITEETGGGGGPDGSDLQLGGKDDYAVVLSNGAGWFITSSNRMAGNTRFIDSSGTVDIDMAVDTYLISSFGGALTARLPPADAAEAIGRTITIKKTDSSANALTITEQGGNGPDQSSQTLTGQYHAITVVSNGGNWFVLGRYN